MDSGLGVVICALQRFGKRTMKRQLILIVLLSLILPLASVSAEGKYKHMYLCRSLGVTLTPKIVQEICDGMKAGRDPQCVRAEADEFKPIASGWGGALALTDGKTRIWFHNPDASGWVHPDYYVSHVNSR